MNIASLKSFVEDKIFLFFCVFFTFSFLWLSQSSPWVETEIFPVHSSKYLFSPYQSEFLFSLKPLFYFLLKLSFLVSEFLNTLPMTSARFLFALNGLGLIALIYQYIKEKTNSYNAILAVLILAGSYVFLERGFRIRSDLLSSFISLSALVINLKFKDTTKHYWTFSLLFSLFLITPKSIYWFAFTLFILLNDSNKKISAPKLLKTLFFIFLFFILVSFLFQDPLFLTSLYQSHSFFQLSNLARSEFFLKAGLINTIYNDSHIGAFIENNPFLVLMIFFNVLFLKPDIKKLFLLIYEGDLLWFLKKNNKADQKSDLEKPNSTASHKSGLKEESLSLNILFLFLFFITLFHPQQKMFFLCALMPFFIILFFTHPKWFINFETHTSQNFKVCFLIFALSFACLSILQFQYKHSSKKVSVQKSTLKELNRFYQNTKTPPKIFDPLCLIYSIKTDCKYLYYNSFINVKDYLKNNKFDIIIPSYGIADLDVLFFQFESFEYVLLKNKIYYKAFVLDLKKNQELYSVKSGDLFSGKKILKAFLKASPSIEKKYFYFYINAVNRPLSFKAPKDCPEAQGSKRLLPGCYYTKTEFQNSFLPVKPARLALFYKAFPSDLKSEESLRRLFRYDLF